MVTPGLSIPADLEGYAKRLLGEIEEEYPSLPFDMDSVPQQHAAAVYKLLAVEIAPRYAIGTEPRSKAVLRLRAVAYPDDRDA